MFKRILLLSGLILAISGVCLNAARAAEVTESKEAIADSFYKALLLKDENLGKYKVTITKKGRVDLGKPIRTLIISEVTFRGFHRIANRFVQAEINGLSVSEEQLRQLKIGKNRHSIYGPEINPDSLAEDLGFSSIDNFKSECTLEGNEILNEMQVYKLKYLPADNRRISESYLFIESTNFELVKAVIKGKPNGRIADSLITIDFSKVFNNYYMPSVIQIEMTRLPRENNPHEPSNYHGEITLSNYQRLDS